MTLVVLQDVTRTYSLGKTAVHAVRNVSLTIESGEFVSLAGPSGSGKSTILNLVGILNRPSEGKVFLDGEDVSTMSDRRRAHMRLERVGFIFQSFNLLPVLTVFENVEYPLILLGVPSGQRHRRVADVLDAVGLSARSAHRPDELSGGERQRVAIARALVTRPQVVLADEPTANLDSATGEDVLKLMQSLNRERQVTFVFASHDPLIIERARRVIRMHDGVVLPADSAVARNPGHDGRAAAAPALA